MTERTKRAKILLRSLKKKTRLATGFSMLEAVVVVGVLLALAVGGFFAYGPITKNAKIAKVKSAVSDVYTAVAVAQIDGDPTTSATDVIAAYNASNDKIKFSIREGVVQPAVAAMTTGEATGDYAPKSDDDFCLTAKWVEDETVSAEMGACESPTPAPEQPNTVPTPTPTATASPTVSPTPEPTATSTPTPTPTSTPVPAEETWQERNPATASSIYSIAMSDTGKVHLVGNSTAIFSSSNMGVNWSSNSVESKTITRSQIVTSKNGEIVLTGSTAAGQQMRISRDGGSTYTSPVTFVNGATGAVIPNFTPTSFSAFGMSADGKVMIALTTAGSPVPWLSNDYGVTWADQSSKNYVGTSTKVSGGTSVSISDDGNKIFVTGGTLHRYSIDAGKTWVRNITAPNESVSTGRYSADMSSDGNVIIAAATLASSKKGILKSTDGGKTWTALTNPDPSYTLNWAAVACSSNCSKMAVSNEGSIYFSSDAGNTWRKQEKIAPQLAGSSPIALSSDGSTLAVGDVNGKFFVGTPKP
jgi:photosystem II stability/assembly factor-like uncharacterized protein/Tfp pilus assembly protein PilE